LPLLDKARTTLETAITALKERLKGPEVRTGMADLMLAGELRNLLASQSGKARIDMIAKSLAEGDDTLAGAALNASRFLTGMSETDMAHVRGLWAQKRKPEELARLRQLEGDLDHLARCGKLVLGWQQQCADQGIVQAARKGMAATAAAIQAATG
jgi:hypothetical protein